MFLVFVRKKITIKQMWQLKKEKQKQKPIKKENQQGKEYIRYQMNILMHVLSEKTAKSNKAKIRNVIILSGKNSLKQIRGKDAIHVQKQLRKLPSNAHKMAEFKGLELPEIIKLNEIVCKPVLSEETVKGIIHTVITFFDYAIRMEYTDLNPFKGMKFKKDYRKKTKRLNHGKMNIYIKFFLWSLINQESQKKNTSTGSRYC